jgi:hypothetical protein
MYTHVLMNTKGGNKPKEQGCPEPYISTVYVRCFWQGNHQKYRVGQNRIYTPYMTVYLVNSQPKIPYTHRGYIWFWPTLQMYGHIRCICTVLANPTKSKAGTVT